MKKCRKCQIEKEETEFSPSQIIKNSGCCISCISIKNKNWREKNPDKDTARKQKWNQANPEKVLANNIKWREEHPETIISNRKKWNKENPEKRAAGRKKWEKENPEKHKISRRKSQNKRYKNDPVFRIRCIVSVRVSKMLKSQGSSKNEESSFDYFPWTPEQLKCHIESQFSLPENLDHNDKIWMTWENQGVYDPKIRDEQNSLTWTWNMDHKIPQSDLPYDSLDHPNFKICWSLENLRPLDSKQNVIDGVRRTRHQKKEEK